MDRRTFLKWAGWGAAATVIADLVPFEAEVRRLTDRYEVRSVRECLATQGMKIGEEFDQGTAWTLRFDVLGGRS